MELTFDTKVIVYKIPREIFLKSIHSSFETEIEYGTCVAFIEDSETLFVSTEGFKYNVSDYITDIIKVNSTEMTFGQYVEQYKERLNKIHADAPVLNKNSTPSEFDPKNPFQRLLDAGVHIKLS